MLLMVALVHCAGEGRERRRPVAPEEEISSQTKSETRSGIPDGSCRGVLNLQSSSERTRIKGIRKFPRLQLEHRTRRKTVSARVELGHRARKKTVLAMSVSSGDGRFGAI